MDLRRGKFTIMGPPYYAIDLEVKTSGSNNLTFRDIATGSETINISEFDIVGLTRAKCRHVKVKRIKEAPIAFECRRTVILQLNETRDLCIGEVIHMHIKDEIIDPKTMRINLNKYDVVARLYGNLYALKLYLYRVILAV